MLESSDQYFKGAFIKVLHQVVVSFPETNTRIENPSKGIEGFFFKEGNEIMTGTETHSN